MKELLIGIWNCLTHPYILINLFIFLFIFNFPIMIQGIYNQDKKCKKQKD